MKGSQHAFQPRVTEKLISYRTQQRVSSSSNIHSQLSFNRPKSEHVAAKRPTTRKLVDDIQTINQEEYDDYKFMVKKISMRSNVNVNLGM